MAALLLLQVPLPALLLALAAAQDRAAPEGWHCYVREDLGAGAEIALSQSVDRSGSYPIHIEVALRPDPSRPATQTWRWSPIDPGTGLAAPASLSLVMRVGKRDGKGSMRVEHDGGTIALPSPLRFFYRTGHGKDSAVSVEDRDALRALWESARWRVSLLDRRGRVRGAAVGALPGRAAIEEAYRRLSPALAAKAGDPATQCDELGDDAFI